jgi:predicted RNA-binding Zn-ribbon protein involved in translation (DUF1610 family)
MEEQPQKIRRRSRRKPDSPSFFRRFRIELVALFLFALGVFLLLEQLEIKETIFRGVVTAFKAITNAFVTLVDLFKETILAFEVSDILGFILIIIAILIIFYRARVQMIAHYAELAECPECGGDLLHVHRLPAQRFLGWLFRIKVRRYRCKKCGNFSLKMRPGYHRSHRPKP